MNVWIGTAGYSYSNWVGPFYPPGTRTTGMLAQYARHFPVVELNFSFYRCPTPAMLTRLAGQTPPGFRFAVKLPRSLSHERRLDDLLHAREVVWERCSAKRDERGIDVRRGPEDGPRDGVEAGALGDELN